METQVQSVDQPKTRTGCPRVDGPIVVGKLIGAFQLGLFLVLRRFGGDLFL